MVHAASGEWLAPDAAGPDVGHQTPWPAPGASREAYPGGMASSSPSRAADASSSSATHAPEGRKMLRLEARNAQTPIEKKPPWIKTRLRTGPNYTEIKGLVRAEGLHTVCEEAGCPNIFECWEDREATFLIGGDQCTRRCDFCQIATG